MIERQSSDLAMVDPVTLSRGGQGPRVRRVVLLGKDGKENTEMGMVVMETAPRDYIFLNPCLDWPR